MSRSMVRCATGLALPDHRTPSVIVTTTTSKNSARADHPSHRCVDVQGCDWPVALLRRSALLYMATARPPLRSTTRHSSHWTGPMMLSLPSRRMVYASLSPICNVTDFCGGRYTVFVFDLTSMSDSDVWLYICAMRCDWLADIGGMRCLFILHGSIIIFVFLDCFRQ
jgi:hypothetical protein